MHPMLNAWNGNGGIRTHITRSRGSEVNVNENNTHLNLTLEDKMAYRSTS